MVRVGAALALYLSLRLVQALRVYTNSWAVQVHGGPEETERVARKFGFISMGQVMIGSNFYHFQNRGVQRKSFSPHWSWHVRLKKEPRVHWFEQQTLKKRKKREIGLVPTDPLFRKQWYMNNDVSPDLNVLTAWGHGFTGQGVVVTILDDGLEKDHPDLAANFDPMASYDFNNDDPDPQPRYNPSDENRHGTRCAGEVAAVANNDVCGAGIAYNARIGGVRMLDGVITDVIEARSLSLNSQHIDIYSASWGPEDDGKTVDGPGILAMKAFYRGIVNGRGGLGSVFVWASGNGGLHYDNCNCDGYSNSIYTLSVGSTTEHGEIPWYSEACASTLTTTFSSGVRRDRQIATTDIRHRCTEHHTGTSASAPLAAGIIALALEANPALTWRDVQHIVVRTSSPANLIADDWVINGVGRKVSHHYGYGLLDAGQLVDLARKWKTTRPQKKCLVKVVHSPQQVSSSLVVSQNISACTGSPNYILSLEHVQAQISLSYTRRGDLEIYLTSPMGTRSVLVALRPFDTSFKGYSNWTFMSTHTWDENPQGIWTLELVNKGDHMNNELGTNPAKECKFAPGQTIEMQRSLCPKQINGIFGKNEQGDSMRSAAGGSRNQTLLCYPTLNLCYHNNQKYAQDHIARGSGGTLWLIEFFPRNSGIKQGLLYSFVLILYGTNEDLMARKIQNPVLRNCVTSDSNGTCLECERPFYAFGRLCISYCPPKYFKTLQHVKATTKEPEISHNAPVCAPCHPSCYFCRGHSANNCTVCPPFSTYDEHNYSCSQPYFPRTDLGTDDSTNVPQIAVVIAMVLGITFCLFCLLFTVYWLLSKISVYRHSSPKTSQLPLVEICSFHPITEDAETAHETHRYLASTESDVESFPNVESL